ncbi:hypothetical protein J6590_029937, partial [Homalodisca vitripennis]
MELRMKKIEQIRNGVLIETEDGEDPEKLLKSDSDQAGEEETGYHTWQEGTDGIGLDKRRNAEIRRSPVSIIVGENHVFKDCKEKDNIEGRMHELQERWQCRLPQQCCIEKIPSLRESCEEAKLNDRLQNIQHRGRTVRRMFPCLAQDPRQVQIVVGRLLHWISVCLSRDLDSRSRSCVNQLFPVTGHLSPSGLL